MRLLNQNEVLSICGGANHGSQYGFKYIGYLLSLYDVHL